MHSRTQMSHFICLDDLVPHPHRYRQLDKLINFHQLTQPLESLYSNQGRKEIAPEFAFRLLFLQFLEDLSDRQMESFIKDNIAAQWFCGVVLGAKTPDHSFFGHFRKRLGTQRLMGLFKRINKSLKIQGVLPEVFTFVDSSQLISKLSTWSDRDKAIRLRLEKFNNKTAAKIAIDPQARFGCKGKGKYWYGYKEHVSVDMQSGMINKIAVTPANTSDAAGLTHICPKQGSIHGDKAYGIKEGVRIILGKGGHDATIKKNNVKGKNKEKDSWLTKLRSPYERVFAHRNKRMRYRGQAKGQFQSGIRALIFNCKRCLVLGIEHLFLVPA